MATDEWRAAVRMQTMARENIQQPNEQAVVRAEIAVGIPVARHPPHGRSLAHAVLILDG